MAGASAWAHPAQPAQSAAVRRAGAAEHLPQPPAGRVEHGIANVPVVKGIQPPKELFDIDLGKVVGLTIDPNRLVEIRRARVRTMGGGARNRQYAELMQIYEELDEAAKLHRRLGCPVIDISELSIEETAHRVLRVIEERRGDQVRA